mmetsp:Transcript_13459/g.29730  ORF Transcript_13459/g.29730 Transcript_13459/m.29730 type:complete len:226 (+) Transcript_13459:1261-1938(+)
MADCRFMAGEARAKRFPLLAFLLPLLLSLPLLLLLSPLPPLPFPASAPLPPLTSGLANMKGWASPLTRVPRCLRNSMMIRGRSRPSSWWFPTSSTGLPPSPVGTCPSPETSALVVGSRHRNTGEKARYRASTAGFTSSRSYTEGSTASKLPSSCAKVFELCIMCSRSSVPSIIACPLPRNRFTSTTPLISPCSLRPSVPLGSSRSFEPVSTSVGFVIFPSLSDRR